MGLCLPATAEPEGYHAEKAKGNIISLAGGATWHIDLEVGTLSAARAGEVEGAIADIVGS